MLPRTTAAPHLLILEQQLLAKRVNLLLKLGNRKGGAMLLRARNRAACWATATAAAPFECCKLLAEDRELPLLLLHGGGQQLVLPLAPVELGLHLLQLRRGVTCCCAPPLRLLHRPCCRQRLQLSSCHGYMARGHATGAHSSRLAEPHTMLLRWR